MLMVAYPEMNMLNLLTFIERLDLEFGYALISPRVRLLWFSDAHYHSHYALFILPCVFVSFMYFRMTIFKFLQCRD